MLFRSTVHGVTKSLTQLSDFTFFLSYRRIKVKSESCSVRSNTLRQHGLYNPWNSPGQNTGVGGYPLFPFPGDLPDPGMEPRSPALQVDSLPAEPQGKPKNTGMGSLSLLQQVLPTQKLNWGLLHCRWIFFTN